MNFYNTKLTKVARGGAILLRVMHESSLTLEKLYIYFEETSYISKGIFKYITGLGHLVVVPLRPLSVSIRPDFVSRLQQFVFFMVFD